MFRFMGGLLLHEFLEKLFELFDTLLKGRVIPSRVLQLLVQPLDGRQRHAVGIHGGDVFVILAQVEGGGEILGHEAEGPRSDVGLVVPLVQRPGCHFVQDLPRSKSRKRRAQDVERSLHASSGHGR